MSLRQRIRRGLSAQALSHGVTIFTQLASVPVLIWAWGAQLYGEWLVLCAVASLVTLCDLGLIGVSQNAMAMRLGEEEKRCAVEVYQGAWLTVTSTSIVVIGIAVVVLTFGSPADLLNIQDTDPMDGVIVLAVVGLATLVSLQSSLISAALSAAGHFATAVNMGTLARLAEALAIMAMAGVGARPVHCAVAVLATQMLLWIVLHSAVRNAAPWAQLGVRRARLETMRALAVPSGASLLLRIGQQFNNQGILLVVGGALGGVGAAAFATMRTLSRVAFQAVNAINTTIIPEIATAWGRGDKSLARHLHRRACQSAVWLSFLIILPLLAFGAEIYTFWTKGGAAFDSAVFGVFLLGGLIGALWTTSSVVPVSTNRQTVYAAVYIAASCVGLIMAFGLAPTFGAIGVAAGILTVEIIMAVSVVHISMSMLGDKVTEYFAEVIKVPLWMAAAVRAGASGRAS